jgi:hypothetical protein
VGGCALAAALGQIKVANFFDNRLGPRSACAIAKALESGAALVHLDLGKNCMREGYQELAAALKLNTVLESLMLAKHSLDNDDLSLFSSMLEANRGLRSLDLVSGCVLGSVLLNEYRVATQCDQRRWSAQTCSCTRKELFTYLVELVVQQHWSSR